MGCKGARRPKAGPRPPPSPPPSAPRAGLAAPGDAQGNAPADVFTPVLVPSVSSTLSSSPLQARPEPVAKRPRLSDNTDHVDGDEDDCDAAPARFQRSAVLAAVRRRRQVVDSSDDDDGESGGQEDVPDDAGPSSLLPSPAGLAPSSRLSHVHAHGPVASVSHMLCAD
jgi:hypothetical protein